MRILINQGATVLSFRSIVTFLVPHKIILKTVHIKLCYSNSLLSFIPFSKIHESRYLKTLQCIFFFFSNGHFTFVKESHTVIHTAH